MSDSVVTPTRSGEIGPIRREIVFEPVPLPERPAEQPAPRRPADPAPRVPVGPDPAERPEAVPTPGS